MGDANAAFVDSERGEKHRPAAAEKTIPLSRTARILWSTAHFAMAIIFLYCTAVQHNDPDWFLWGAGYLSAAIGCFSLMFQSYGTVMCTKQDLRMVSRWMALLSVVALCIHFFLEEKIEFTVNTEVGREGLGLMLVVGWFAVSSLGTPQPAVVSHSE